MACGRGTDAPGSVDAEDVGSVKQAVTYAPQPVANNTSKRVFMHYMPWFEAKNNAHGYSRKNVNGAHWTMANCTGETNGVLNNVCAVDKPVIGPYSSSDPYVIEYHLLLMKYAGMDGVVIDWGGVMNVEDLPDNKYNGEQLINRVADFGLNFFVVMEDRNYVRDNGGAGFGNPPNDADDTADAAADLNCLKAGGTCGNTYFGHSKYEKINNVPLLGIFGPITLQNGTSWNNAYSQAGLNTGSTSHFGLWWENGELGSYNDGSMAWMWAGQGSKGDASWSHLTHAQYYADAEPAPSGNGIKMPSVFPGHDPYYGRGGWGSDAGNFFVPWNVSNIDATMNIALASNGNYIQLATFNDFGEDTVFEPSVARGFSALEKVQQKLGVSYGKSHLELIKRLFDQRVIARKANNTTRLLALDDASAYLAALNVSAAQTIIDGTAPPPPNGTQSAYGSGQAIPTTIQAENYDNGGEGIAFHDTNTANDGNQYRTAAGSSVDIEVTGDTGGGYNIGWTNPGEWTEYTFTNSTTRNYDIKVRVAAPGTGGKISVSIDDVIVGGIKDVPSTGAYQTYTDLVIKTNHQIVSGTHVMRVTTEQGGFNFNNIGVAASATGPVCGNGSCESGESCSSCTADCGSCSTQAPFGGTAKNLPGLLEMDKFDTGGQGIAFSDDGVKSGGAIRPETNVDLENHNGTGVNVGWTLPGEYLEWTVNVLEAGTYDMRIMTAGNGGTFKFTTTGATSYDSGTINAAATGQWQSYQQVSKTGFTLNAGTHVVRLEMFGTVAYNLKNMEFVKTGTGTPPPGPSPIVQWPYGSTQAFPNPLQIPGTIQAENFDEGGPTLAYSDTSPTNEGNSNHRSSEQVDLCFHGNVESKICYGAANEWTEYTVNVQQAAKYDITARYTNGCSGNGSFGLRIDGVGIGTFTATPLLNDWGTFRTATLQDVSLQPGNHILQYINFSGCHDVDWFSFVVDSGQTPPPPPNGPTLTKTLKNVANNMYAYRDGQVVKYTSNPDTYGAAAQWLIEDFSGYKRIRNVGDNCLVNVEHLYAYAECNTGTPDGWMSNRWTVTMVGSNYVFSNAWQNTELNCYNNPSAGVQCTERGTSNDAQWIYTP
jgi:hypothetical protein